MSPEPPEIRRVLVTGGYGSIGRRIVSRFLDAGTHVRILDTRRYGDVDQRCEQIVGSILNRDVARESVSSCDAVIHLAAVTSVGRCAEDPIECFETNVIGTASIVSASRHAGVAHVVLASTAYVYGDTGSAPLRESSPLRPESAYAASKAAAELAASACATADTRVTILRVGNVYGPGCSADTVIAQLIDGVRQGNRASFRSGAPVRDFVFVEDVSEAFVRIVQCGAPADHVAVLNVGTGEGHSVRDVAACLADVASAAGLDRPAIVEGETGGRSTTLVLSVDALARRAGWRPTTTLAEGLRLTLESELRRS